MVAYSFKRRFVPAIKLGLGMKVHHEPGDRHIYVPKRQTIRAVGKRRHVYPGETAQLYTGMRTKHCEKIGDGKCRSTESIRIWLSEGRIEVSGERVLDLDEFARHDGFDNWSEMREFWLQEHGEGGKIKQLGPWSGLLIKWEPING